MENQIPNRAQPQGAQKPAETSAAATRPLPKNQNKRNRRLVVGCLSAFGCSIFLFVGILFAFLSFGSTDNPIFSFFGVAPGEVVNVLIALVNLVFLVTVFIAFVVTVIGIFKISTAKKDDKEARRRGVILTFGALASMVLLVFVWVFAYFFLASKRTSTIRTPITTVPEKTINLTAPVTIKFDAGAISINRRQFDILSYRWDFDDGTELTGNPQTHTFTELGNFKVTLIITVKERTTAKEQEVTFTRDVTIQNVLADVVIEAMPASGPAPLKVKLNALKSSSVNGEITAYAWDLDEDGEYDDSTDALTETTFEKIGKYTVGLRVTDSTGAFATGEKEIEATPPDTPVAVITVEGIEEGATLEVNKAYTFSAAQSLSPSGTVDRFSWQFGDGGTASTRTATHSFKAAGDYDVTLSVIDSAKKQSQTVKRFTAGFAPVAPIAVIKTTPVSVSNTVSGQAPFTVIFDGTPSADSNENIVEYLWDFDGDQKTDDSNAVTSYTYTAAGIFNASLTAIDSTNLTGKTQMVVKVSPEGLKADIKADNVSGIVPLTVKFDASGSRYSNGAIVSYEWNFGDGSADRISSAQVNYQYTAIGTFTARVTAVASDGTRATAQIPIAVRPVPVNACFTPNQSTGTAPMQAQFDPSCSTGTVVRYNWKFANLGSSGERKPNFTFMNPGSYEVTLEVADSQNVVDSYSKTITVTAP